MQNRMPEPVNSFEHANNWISWIKGYETEAEVDAAARQIVQYFDLESYVFGALRRVGEREQYRYLVGCAPQWCYVYNQNKWYAIDPFIDYALHNTSPALASDIPLTTPGQGRLLDAAAEHGFRSGIVVPAHSASAIWIGVLYLGTNEDPEHAERSFSQHRNLMRAFALELLEWWDSKLRGDSLEDLELDDLDIDLLCKAQDQATAEEAARELGITVSRVNSRYERLNRKLEVTSKRHAVERALALGLIKPTP
jgi:DNA-binding CsgD family transcriptional regulator